MTTKKKAGWMQQAVNPAHKGEFSAAAKKAGMTTAAYAAQVLNDPSAPAHLKHQAQFAANAIKITKKKKGSK